MQHSFLYIVGEKVRHRVLVKLCFQILVDGPTGPYFWIFFKSLSLYCVSIRNTFQIVTSLALFLVKHLISFFSFSTIHMVNKAV